MISFSISFILSYVVALLAMAFYTLMERKLLGYFQLRKGPNKVMLTGIPQPFADAIKLFAKEQTNPTPANISPYMFAPILGLILALLLWSIFPHSNPTLFLNYGILFFLCVSSMNVYTTFLAGWCSNSKYALLGALRSIAQTISYEVSMTLILLTILLMHKSMDLNLMKSMSWPILMLTPLFIMWFITNLAETNRTPFDFAEGESELVSGFNVEYSAGMFALIFMAEYMNILFMSLLTVTLYTGSINLLFNIQLILKTMVLATLFVWIRATLPRMRYDNLMYLTWKSFLPLSLASIIIILTLTVVM